MTHQGFPGGANGKEPICQCKRHKRCGFGAWVRTISLEEGTAAHSSILALRISWTEETGGLQPIESHMIEATEYACIHDSAIPLLGIFRENHNLKRCMYSNVHCRTSFKKQDMEATYMSINGGKNKEDVIHI